MTRLLASLSLLALLGACAAPGPQGTTYSDTSYRAVNGSWATYDPGPYFSVPTGGLAATAYWGMSQYDPYANWSWVHWSELGW